VFIIKGRETYRKGLENTKGISYIHAKPIITVGRAIATELKIDLGVVEFIGQLEVLLTGGSNTALEVH